MKWTGIGLILICGILLGRVSSVQMNRHEILLRDWIRFFHRVQAELRYTMAQPQDLLRRTVQKDLTEETVRTCLHHCEQKVPFPKAWRMSVEKDCRLPGKETQRLLLRLGEILGAFDLQGQTDQIDLLIEQLQEQLRETEKENAKNIPLYRDLCLFGSLAVAVLLW